MSFIGAQETALNKDELEKEASSSSSISGNDNITNSSDSVVLDSEKNDFNMKNAATTVASEECNDESRSIEVESVMTESEQFEIAVLDSLENDDNCMETNLSEVIETEVTIENECDNDVVNTTTTTTTTTTVISTSADLCHSERTETDTIMSSSEQTETVDTVRNSEPIEKDTVVCSSESTDIDSAMSSSEQTESNAVACKTEPPESDTVMCSSCLLYTSRCV